MKVNKKVLKSQQSNRILNRVIKIVYLKWKKWVPKTNKNLNHFRIIYKKSMCSKQFLKIVMDLIKKIMSCNTILLQISFEWKSTLEFCLKV